MPRWTHRWMPLTGILFVSLFLFGVVLVDLRVDNHGPVEVARPISSEEVPGDAPANNTLRDEVGSYCLLVASAVFLLFANYLGFIVVKAEPKLPLLATGTILSGLGATLILVWSTVYFLNHPGETKDLGLGLVIFNFLAWSLILFTTIASIRHRLLARMFNWFSAICVLGLLPTGFFVPNPVLLSWLALTSVLLFLRQRGSEGS